MNSLTRSLAFELRRSGITVVSIDPGWVRTDMGGSSAPLLPETSVSGMLRVIDQLGIRDTGTFLRWDGATMPW